MTTPRSRMLWIIFAGTFTTYALCIGLFLRGHPLALILLIALALVGLGVGAICVYNAPTQSERRQVIDLTPRLTIRRMQTEYAATLAAEEPACTKENPCCERRNEYNGYGSDGPTSFRCPHQCTCHD